ncbi:hypothetical protein ABE65_017740 [Fictibacillus phosphorivorans]|uniref:Uncharacterized protein n=1 Tax=Fictibacillus phosphorivorans TaxID=1221500 RepID=A0A160IRG6_9BACL|nr:hypothetical protein [Fictibacillus phosphorivorans]ANC78542.1 hypothetical protein ABE65_017740 [Fictibacillus phosphorivorans]
MLHLTRALIQEGLTPFLWNLLNKRAGLYAKFIVLLKKRSKFIEQVNKIIKRLIVYLIKAIKGKII